MSKTKTIICIVAVLASMNLSIASAQRAEPAIGMWVIDNSATEAAILAKNPLALPHNFGMLGWWALFVYEITPVEVVTAAYSMENKYALPLESCSQDECKYSGVIKAERTELKVVTVGKNHVRIYNPKLPESAELLWKRVDKFSPEKMTPNEAQAKGIEWIHAMQRIQKAVDASARQ